MKKGKQVYIKKELHDTLKKMAVDRDTTIQDLVNELILRGMLRIDEIE